MKLQNINSTTTRLKAKSIFLSLMFFSGIFTTAQTKNNPEVELDINSWTTQESIFDSYQICQTTITHAPEARQKIVTPQKDWTIILYLAADNDLGPFAVRNIKQMASVGSTKHVNILIHLDIKTVGRKKVTRRFYVEKNKLVQLNTNDPITQKMDSGDPQTLISCFKWASHDFPAENYALFLWDHGTGSLDPASGRIFNANELFTYNANTNKLELDRSIGYLEYVGIIQHLNTLEQRGICWDDTTGNYLTNQKLEFALKAICKECLNGKKISILGFDACLMGCIEIASIAKKYAEYMVASQEVVLGSGWNYQKTFAPFIDRDLPKEKFAEHIVLAFDDTYSHVTNDYTQAAINLAGIIQLEKSINTISLQLMECLKKQTNGSVKKAIQTSRNKRNCTHFDEPSYIDLNHFLCNIQQNLNQFKLSSNQEEVKAKQNLNKNIEDAKKLISKIVIANKTGSNLRKASGISIYFPEHRIHSSYKKTSFAASNYWFSFLSVYLFS